MQEEKQKRETPQDLPLECDSGGRNSRPTDQACSAVCGACGNLVVEVRSKGVEKGFRG